MPTLFPCPSPRWHLDAEFWCPQGKLSPSASSLAQSLPPDPPVLVIGQDFTPLLLGLHLILLAGDFAGPFCLCKGG